MSTIFLRELAAVGFACLCSASSFADGDLIPRIVNNMPNRVFIPTGFDDNDNSQIVVQGAYSNTCYRVGPTAVTINHQIKKVLIEDQTYHYAGFMCLMVLVPYVKTIDLGLMEAGGYEVYFGDSNRQWHLARSFSISHSTTSGPDNFLYAPVEEIAVRNGRPGEARVAVLKGHYTNTCMSLVEVKILHNDPSVVEVLPIAELATDPSCRNAKIAFEKEVLLPDGLNGQTLLHVRSLNGQAVNRVVEF